MNKNKLLKNTIIPKRIGDWGLGIGDWGLGPIPIPNPQSPNPQSPIPNPHYLDDKINNFENNLIK